MSTARGPPSWDAILRQAITTPGLIHEAYRRFHRFSLRNRLLAMSQCLDRGIVPGPLATYGEWERLGRHVLRGEKALVLCMPVRAARQKEEDEKEETEPAHDEERASSRVFFIYRARWFVLSQTDGAEHKPVAVPAWSEERALETLDVRRVPFDELDGNIQGYATKDRRLAISPVAALPYKTLFHELAHLLLEHVSDDATPTALCEVEAEGVALLCCEALVLDGAEYARGYLQHWLQDDELTDAMAQRIINTAHRILTAGNDGATLPEVSVAGCERTSYRARDREAPGSSVSRVRDCSG